MDFKTETAVLSLYENGNCAAECTVDGEYLLPDYCPDIAAVLKCTMTPVVLARRVGGDKLVVEGEATVHVLYLDEGRKCTHTFECVQPFSGTLPWEENDGNLPYVTARVNYLNCRATSPRRIQVHGTLSACCKQEKKREVEVLSDIAGKAVYCKRDTVCCTSPTGNVEKSFSITETVDVGINKPSAERIVRTAATAVVDTVKQLTDKAIVKGKVTLRTLYTVDLAEGTTACAIHEFPFSQILDLEGLCEGDTVNACVDVLSRDVQVKTDANGNGTLLSVNLKLCVRLDAFGETQAAIVTDVYTATHPSYAARTQFLAEQLLFSCQDTTTLKEVLDLPSDSISEIVDLWCEVVSLSTRTDGQHSYVDGRLQFSLLARDRDGCISYYEHTGDFVLQFAQVCDRLAVEVYVTDTDFAVVGGRIEIRMELFSVRQGYAQKHCDGICGFETETEPYAEEKAALRICRAKKGDSVWEIAKKCHTAMDAIMEENALSEEYLAEDMLLLIPLCR